MSHRPNVIMTLTQLWHRVPGGTASSMLGLAEAVTRTGRVDLAVVGARGEIRRPRSMLCPSRVNGATGGDRQGVRLHHLPLPIPILYDAWARFGRPAIDRGLDDVDLIHLTVPVVPPRSAVPLVATVHDLFPLTHPHLLSARGVGVMARGLAAIRERAAKVLVSTKVVADECVRAGFEPNRIEIAPFGVAPVEVDDDDVSDVRRRYGITGPYVLFVGTHEPRKNLGLLLEALVGLNDPDLSLVIAGPKGWGDPRGDSVYASLSDVPSPVIDVGFVPTDDLPALQRGAVAFCYPSLAEGFGLPVLEAMAAGAVIVTTRDSAMAEVAGDAAMLVDPHDPAGLAATIRHALDDEVAMAQRRRAGFNRSREFTWQSCAEATCDVYESVLR